MVVRGDVRGVPDASGAFPICSRTSSKRLSGSENQRADTRNVYLGMVVFVKWLAFDGVRSVVVPSVQLL